MRMHHVPHTPEIDLTGIVDEEYSDDVAFANVNLKAIFDDYYKLATYPHADFPVFWQEGDEPCDGHGGPPVDDPTTIYVGLPLAGFGDTVVYSVSIAAMVDQRIDEAGGEFWEERREAKLLADGLRALADKIDAAILLGSRHK